MKIANKFLPEIIVIPFLFVLFLITRLYSLLSLPMFTDEAIYTRWAQIAKADSSWRFISLTDGKQPSFVWADMIMMRFVEDPLLAGRLVSVIAGFFIVLGVYFLTREIFHKYEKKGVRIIALIATTFAVFYPFSLVYDRMAIYESMTAAFFIWALYFQIMLVRRLRFDIAMVLGFVLAGGVLTKSSIFLSIYMTPFLLLLFNFRKKDLRLRFLKFAVYFAVSAGIAYGLYQILRLSPYFHIISQKNSVFVYTPFYWLTDVPLSQKIEFIISNSRGLFDWFVTYFTIPFIVLAALSFFINKKLFWEKTILLLWFVLPLLSLCIFGKTLYPRYLLFMTMPLIPLVAFGLYELLLKYKNSTIRGIIIVILVYLPLRSDYLILTDFARAPIPRIDLEQFINGWPAGGGINESVEFFKMKAQNGEIMVGTQGTFGLMPAAYEIYLKDYPNIRVNGFWPVENDKLPDLLIHYSRSIPTYFVFYQPCSECDFPGIAPDNLPLKKITSYKKGVGDAFLTIYQVIPEKSE